MEENKKRFRWKPGKFSLIFFSLAIISAIFGLFELVVNAAELDLVDEEYLENSFADYPYRVIIKYDLISDETDESKYALLMASNEISYSDRAGFVPLGEETDTGVVEHKKMAVKLLVSDGKLVRESGPSTSEAGSYSYGTSVLFPVGHSSNTGFYSNYNIEVIYANHDIVYSTVSHIQLPTDEIYFYKSVVPDAAPEGDSVTVSDGVSDVLGGMFHITGLIKKFPFNVFFGCSLLFLGIGIFSSIRLIM